MKVVINRNYGGFGLSKGAMEELAIRKGWIADTDMYKYVVLINNDNEVLHIYT